jgi:hypothetical protein
MRFIIKRLSRRHTTAVAYLALFVALGGSSYAALRVGSEQIVNDSVRSRDIRNNEIRSKDVRDGALLAKDFEVGQLPAGPKGDLGARGEAGEQGPPGISGLVRVDATSANNSDSVKFANAICPAGKRVIGSGAELSGAASGIGVPPNQTTDVVIDEITPSEETVVPGIVIVRAYEDEPTAEDWRVNAYALCANVS